MDEPLDELYFRWLYSQVGSVKTRVRARTYWGLLRQLYTTEFVWFVPNDDNRAMEGLELRQEFLQNSDISVPDESWMAIGCSFLEMLIAMSRRFSFECGREPSHWFWLMMRNLKLDSYNDAGKIPEGIISARLDTVIWRRYGSDGHGGIFPLEHPEKDQRKVEIWYQFNAYMLENGY